MEQGVSILNAGSPANALGYFIEAIETNPQNGIAHYNAGVACQELADHDQAVGHYRHAIRLLPALGQAHHNLGQALAHRRDIEGAVSSYRKALEIDPHDFKSAYNLSILLRQAGDLPAAIRTCRQAITAKPDYARAFSTLGLMFSEQHRYDEALVCLEQAVKIDPGLKEAYYNMGVTYQKCGKFERSVDYYNKALTCDPCYAPARWLSMLSLPMLYESPSQIVHYRSRFETNLSQLIRNTWLGTEPLRRFALEGVKTSTNFYLQYQGGDDLVLQKKYGQFAHNVVAANYPSWAVKRPMPQRQTGAPLRIGYVSTYMCQHTVGTFLSGWVENHDRSAFDIHCYHVGRKQDEMTDHFRMISDHFHHFPGDVDGCAQQIASDDLHLLVYSDIGMDTTTLILAAMRLAPIQCKGWGHPVTTGLPTVDYYLSSDLMEPEGAEQFYSERLIRLPNLALCYQRPKLPEQPKSREALGLPEQGFIYLTTQSIFKYLPQYDHIFVQIAHSVPDARFVFVSNPSQSATDRFRHRLRRSFEANGLDADDYCFFSPRLNFDDFLSLNMAADVMLDTFEWSGGKTTLEALSCGLPVVTCPGRFMRGRHAYAMLNQMGVGDTIAADQNDYCQIAIRLALDSRFFDRVKTKISNGRSRLYGDLHFIRSLEVFYRSVVEKNPETPPQV